MSKISEPTDWDDCFSIQKWLEQWINDGTVDEERCAFYLIDKDKKGLNTYLAETMGSSWTNLSTKEIKVVWDCAIRCWEAQLAAYDALGITNVSMKSTNSIRW